jgi:hypothetical protein
MLNIYKVAIRNPLVPASVPAHGILRWGAALLRPVSAIVIPSEARNLLFLSSSRINQNFSRSPILWN